MLPFAELWLRRDEAGKAWDYHTMDYPRSVAKAALRCSFLFVVQTVSLTVYISADGIRPAEIQLTFRVNTVDDAFKCATVEYLGDWPMIILQINPIVYLGAHYRCVQLAGSKRLCA